MPKKPLFVLASVVATGSSFGGSALTEMAKEPEVTTSRVLSLAARNPGEPVEQSFDTPYLTKVKVALDTEGKAKNCEVIVPSGKKLADAFACRRAMNTRYRIFRMGTGTTSPRWIGWMASKSPMRPERDTSVSRLEIHYPKSEYKQLHEGNVGTAYTLDASGRVEACSVESSSGWPVLDDAACLDMLRYAEFSIGQVVLGMDPSKTATTTIRWKLD